MMSLLLTATLVLCAGFAAPLLLPQLPVWARAVWRVLSLLLLTFLAVRIVGSPLQPALRPGTAWDRLWQQAVVVGWWIMAARSAADVAHLILRLRNRSRETQILSDLIGGGIYLAAAFVVVDMVFAVPVGGLIATSGVVAVVIGLALQSTLSDVFSGIAIDIERPYRAGDMLWVEGGIEGRVQEVNWRSTRVVTGSGDVATVPNSVMAKSRLINHSLPAPVRHAAVEVRLDPRVMPDRCRAALDAAARACLLPLATPKVNLTALHGDGAVYEMSYAVPTSENLGAARSELLAQVQRHLFHAGIPLAVDGVADMPTFPIPDAGDLLARSDITGDLSDQDRALLAARMVEVAFEEGAIVFDQGEAVDAFYLILAGTIGILRRQPDGTEVRRRMSPGSGLGLVGLVTGAPFAATATALTPVKAYRLGKAAFAEAIQTRPELMTSLEGLAHRIQMAYGQEGGTDEEQRTEEVDALLKRMRTFLRFIIGDAQATTT